MKKIKTLAAAAALVTFLTTLAWGSTASAAFGTTTSVRTGKLVVWTYFKDPGQLKALQDMKKLFNAKYPKVEVVYQTQPFAQMTSNLLAAAAARTGPDVVIYQFGDVLKLQATGALGSMQKFAKAWKDTKLFPAGVQARVASGAINSQGNLYAIQPYVNLIGLYYNKDVLAKAGISAPPTTITELTADLRKIKASGNQGLVFDAQPGVDGWWGGMPWMWANGVDINMASAKQSVIASTLATVRSYITDGLMSQDVVTIDQATAMQKFLTGNYGFTVNGNWELAGVTKSAKFAWDVARFPSGTQESSVYLGGEGVGIGGFSKRPDLAWAYLTTSWLSKAGQASLVGTVGSIPVRQDVASDPSIKTQHGLPAFIDSARTGRPLPITTGENAAQSLFGDEFSAVVSGQKTADVAAQELVAQTPALLAKK